MTPAGFDPAIPSVKRLQTYTLDRVATRIGTVVISLGYIPTKKLHNT